MLRFRADGTFAIVQITDVHWRNGEHEDLRSRDLLARLLDVEQPDFVAVTGDLVEGWESRDPGEALRQAVAPIESRAIPWAFAFGNHDDEGSLSRLALLSVQQGLRFCLTERGPADVTGVGNYALRISSARSASLAAVLYFFDSGGLTATGIGDYAWVSHDQIGWYLRTARALGTEYGAGNADVPPGGRLPALAFLHIPLPEFEQVWASGTCRGNKLEAVCCPAINSGLFAAFVEAGDVMGVFVGHDHLNDFEGELHGIRLCYGRQSGYASYGSDDFPRGARIIRLRENERRLETWLRLDETEAPTEQVGRGDSKT